MKINGQTIKLSSGEKITIEVEEQQLTEQPIEQSQVTENNLLYRVGLISDMHFDIEDSNNSEYANDLKNALNYFNNNNIAFISSCGDVCQYKDKDLKLFHDAYNSNLRLFTCLGNHDYLRIFSLRDAAHAIPSEYKDGPDMWEKTIGVLRKNDSDIHFFDDTPKGKQNYWFEKNGDIFVNISIDYGISVERYDVIRAINKLNYNSDYVKQMTSYVSDTLYDRNLETNFDYLFYNPAVLIWLKNLVELNKNKRIFLMMHHFMPNMAGDTNNSYKHLRIWPYPTSAEIKDKFYSGSNTICGLTFWFLDKLFVNNQHIICFGGHSHYSIKEQEDVMHRRYVIKLPNGKEVTPLVDDLNSLTGTKYDYGYYQPINHSISDTAYTVHLPSLSKPLLGSGQSQYGASEGAIMDVYDDHVQINYIKFKEEGSNTYINKTIKTVIVNTKNNTDPIVEPPKQKQDDSFEGIKVIFHNKTGETIRFSGKFHMYTQEDKDAISLYLCPPANTDGGYAHWAENPYSLKNNETMEFIFNDLTEYIGNGKTVTTTKSNISKHYGKHFRIADTAEWPSGIAAIKFGVYAYDRSSNDTSTGASMIHAKPILQNNCLIKEGGVYEIILDRIKDNATLDKNYINIPYTSSDTYKYVIL